MYNSELLEEAKTFYVSYADQSGRIWRSSDLFITADFPPNYKITKV